MFSMGKERLCLFVRRGSRFGNSAGFAGACKSIGPMRLQAPLLNARYRNNRGCLTHGTVPAALPVNFRPRLHSHMTRLTDADRALPQPAATSEVVFSAQALTKVYHMGEVDVHALRGVDLELYAKEFVVLLGPSGSGKSTLLNILGGLDVPSGGTV